jgi:hypothetical protein
LLKKDFAMAHTLKEEPERLQKFLLNRRRPALPRRIYGSHGIHWSYTVTSCHILLKINLLAPKDRPEKATVFLMDELGENVPKAPLVFTREKGTETTDGWAISLRVPRKTFSGGAFRVGVERFYEDAHGQPHFDNDLSGRFSHDVRLRYLYFMAEKTRLALLV